jgi:hypothetical protein
MKANSIATKIVFEMMCPQIRADAEQLAFEGKVVALRDLLAVNHPPALIERLVPFFIEQAEAWRKQCGEDLPRSAVIEETAQPQRLYHVGGRNSAKIRLERLGQLVRDTRSKDPRIAEAARQTLAMLTGKGRKDG